MKTFKEVSTKAGLICAVSLGLLHFDAAVTAQTFTTIWNFGNLTNGAGIHPASQLIPGPNGTLYGTASQGPGILNGTVFKMRPDGRSCTVLKSFNFTNDEGVYPYGGPQGRLMLAGDTLYGTISEPEWGNGAVFRVNTDGTGYAVLKQYPFFWTSEERYPNGGLALSGSTVYGTTFGGSSWDQGTLFRVNTDGRAYEVLKRFAQNDGNYPSGELTLFNGVLYGTTVSGGSSDAGTAFKLNIDGTGYKVLKQFSGSDGRSPYAGLTLFNGVLYGTTYSGGRSDVGTVFKVSTNGTGFAVLKDFTPSDGRNPYASLTLLRGVLYGTTHSGGSSNAGTVFKLNTDGTGYRVLKHFTGSDGRNPYAGLALFNGVLYGTTYSGGISNAGTVFRIELPAFNSITAADGFIILNWIDSAFALQSAPEARGPYTTILGARSPYTNAISGTQKFFRLIGN